MASGRPPSPDGRFAARLTRDELHVAARIDNFRHIAMAYGEAVAAAVCEEVCRTFRDLVAIGYFGSGTVLPGEDGLFSLILGSAADAPDTGPDSLPARFAIVWSVIGSSAFAHGGSRIHVAIAATSARSLVPAAWSISFCRPAARRTRCASAWRRSPRASTPATTRWP